MESPRAGRELITAELARRDLAGREQGRGKERQGRSAVKENGHLGRSRCGVLSLSFLASGVIR